MEVGKHGFEGACSPEKLGDNTSIKTFSVGIFEWRPKNSGRGLKKGPVKVRVRGDLRSAEAVYARAQEIVALLDRGTYSGPKLVILK